MQESSRTHERWPARQGADSLAPYRRRRAHAEYRGNSDRPRNALARRPVAARRSASACCSAERSRYANDSAAIPNAGFFAFTVALALASPCSFARISATPTAVA